MAGFDRRGDRIDARLLAAFRIDGDAEHLPLQNVDDRRTVRLILDQYPLRVGVQRLGQPDRVERLAEGQVSVQAVAQIVIGVELAPDRDAHEVAGVGALERRVHGDDLRAEVLDAAFLEKLPPRTVHEVAALHTGTAHIQGLPRTGAALGVVDVGRFELFEPRVVLAQLGAQRVAGSRRR